jgi:hypothetical protein
MDVESMDGWRRLARSSPNFLYPGVDAKVMAKALECAPAPCSALTEASWVHAAVGELSPTNTSTDFWPLLDKQACDGSVRQKIRASKPNKPTDAKSALAEGPQIIEAAFPAAK